MMIMKKMVINVFIFKARMNWVLQIKLNSKENTVEKNAILFI